MMYRRGRVWWFRLYNSHGESEPRSTGTRDKQTARDIEALCDRLRSRRQWVLLDALWRRDVTIGAVMDHDAANTLDTLAAETKDVDLVTQLPAWGRALRARFPKATGHDGTPAKYAAHVGAFLEHVGGTLPASRFTAPLIDAFTAQLGVAPATVSRYLAALSSFGQHCVRAGVLAANPVRDVTWPRERDLTRRTRHLTFREQMRLIDAAPPQSALQLTLVLAHLGVEWGAIYALTRADVDLARRTLHARGTKTRTRDRTAHIEQWAMPYLTAACKALLPDGRVIEAQESAGGADGGALRVRLAAHCAALGITDYRLHDGRHTYAVRHYAAGVSPEAIGRQLGHKDGSEVVERYGRFTPTTDDRARYEAMARARDEATEATGE